MLKCSLARHNYQTKYETNDNHNSPRPRMFNQAEPWNGVIRDELNGITSFPFPIRRPMIVFPVTNLVRGGRAGIRTRPCALPPALPFLLSLRVLRPSRLPPFSRRSIPLSSPPRTSPSSLLRRVESPPDVPSSGSQSRSSSIQLLSSLLALYTICAVHSNRRLVDGEEEAATVSRAGELVNYPNDQDSTWPAWSRR